MTEKKQIEVLEWFAGRAGDHIKNEHYQRLLVELANVLVDNELFKTVDDVIDFMQMN